MSNLATINNNLLADSGIDDLNVVVTTGSYSNPAWITALAWTKITGTPTTLLGYGITNAYTKTEVDTLLSAKQNTLTLTTTGTSGAATLVGATLNIPQYQSVLTNPVTGTGTANQIAYWTSTSAIGALSTATYPSLTELSYVKGVTSAIQTQIDSKQATLTLTTTGTSGVATLVGATLNIPNYGSALSGYLPLLGGTMTGNINWAQTDRGITWAFNTDGASIKFYNTGDGDTDSRLEFATLDNNDEYFRWVHIPSGGTLYELMRLKAISSGNSELIVNGKIIKSGGTASQYLMADGSVSTLTNPVTGTGTTGTIPKWTSSSAIGNSIISESSSIIEINGSTRTLGTFISTSGGTERYIQMLGYNSAYATIRSNVGFNASYNSLAFIVNTNSTETGQGSVTIPSWQMVLGGSLPNTDSFYIQRSEAGSFTFSNLLKVLGTGQVQFNSYTSSSSFTGTVAGVLGFTSAGSIITLSSTLYPSGSGTANYITRWITANTVGTGLIFDNGVGVSIGTTVVNDTLHLNSGYIRYGIGPSFPDIYGKIGHAANAGGFEIISQYSGGNIGSGVIRFINGIVGSTSEKMRVDYTGNVGVNNSSPKTKLDISGVYGIDSKSVTVTNSYTTGLTVNLSNHTGVYIKVTLHGDLSGNSAVAYMGEFFIQNGASGYAEPGIIIREVNNTNSGSAIFSANIVDPAGTGARNFDIQFKQDSATTSVGCTLVYQIQGNYNSIS